MTDTPYSRDNILTYLEERVAGQEQAKKVLATAGFLHMSKALYSKSNGFGKRIKSSSAMLIGPSGCGKTFMASTLANCLGLPFLEINARSLSADGYKGTSISDHFEAFYWHNSLHCSKEIEYSVVFIDEFDKLCNSGVATGSWDITLQNSLLKIIEGTYVKFSEKHGGIDTHKMLFIIGGNFQSIREERKKRNRPLGFGNQQLPKGPDIRQELMQAGVTQELVGRVSLISEISQLTRHQLRETLLRKKDSVYQQYKDLYLDIYGKELELSSCAIKTILDKCEKTGLGARGLHSALDEYVCRTIGDCEIDTDEFLDDII